jgi:MFS family permease
MSRVQPPSVRSVFDTLASEGFVAADWLELLERQADARSVPQPWYVRAMVGFGAWLAASLLIVFIAGLSLAAAEGGILLVGLVFLVAAVALRRKLDNDFSNQLALATGLAGQGLFAYGVADLGGDTSFQLMLFMLIVINAILLAVYPDKTQRFLSVNLIVAPIAFLLYINEAQAVVPLLGPALAGLLVLMFEKEAWLHSHGLEESLSPVRAGVMVSAFGCLMLSTLYVLPELIDDFVFYPRPWLSTLLLGLLLLYVEGGIVAALFASRLQIAAGLTYSLTLLALLASAFVPGLVLSILVVALGARFGNRVYLGAGIVFLVVFTSAFFYGMYVDMLTKSGSLIATGGIVLVCRWLLLHAAGSAETRKNA